MPTDEWFKENPKVSAYIPQNLNEKLLEWMKGRSIKKVSQALTTILEEHLGVVQNKPIAESGEGDRLEALEQKLESLSQIVQELREPIQASIQRVVQTELFPVEPVEEPLSYDEAIALIDAKQPIEVIEEIQDDEPDEILSEFLEPEAQTFAQRTDEQAIKTLESEQVEESSPKVEGSSLILENQESEGFKPIMTNTEVSQLLNESSNTIRSRHRHGKEFKAKGCQFIPIEEEGKPRWKVEKLGSLN
jgi:hypothetical protein